MNKCNQWWDLYYSQLCCWYRCSCLSNQAGGSTMSGWKFPLLWLDRQWQEHSFSFCSNMLALNMTAHKDKRLHQSYWTSQGVCVCVLATGIEDNLRSYSPSPAQRERERPLSEKNCLTTFDRSHYNIFVFKWKLQSSSSSDIWGLMICCVDTQPPLQFHQSPVADRNGWALLT